MVVGRNRITESRVAMEYLIDPDDRVKIILD